MSRLLGKGLVLAAVVALLPTAAGQAQVPDKFTNLKVLPKDISREDLVNTMKGFALGLGVRCQFCHVGEGDDLSTFDFASDAMEHKQVAREMLLMTMEINRKFIAKIAEEEKDSRVRCMTCHRGKEEPTLDMN